MKNKLLTTIALLCFSIGAIAQDQEVWGCQQDASTGLFWENNRWVSKRVLPETLLLKLPTTPPFVFGPENIGNRSNGSYKIGDGNEFGMFCRTNLLETVSCISTVGDGMFYFSRESGKLGRASLFGSLMDGDRRDTVLANIYNCTKF